MESLPPPLVNRRWLLCAIASFLGYLLLSYSLQRAFRPSTTMASFPEMQGATNLTSDSAAISTAAPRAAVAFLQEIVPPSPAPQPVTHAAMSAPPQPSAVVEVALLPSNKPELLLLLSPQSSLNSSRSNFNASSTSNSSEVLTNKEILIATAEEVVEKKKKKKKKCDLFDGRWVYDRKQYPMYRPHWCPFLSDQVSCRRNGRPDYEYEHWRWQPNGCDLPRFNGREMLERWRGKRVVIVGDSLNRNMWESLACMLYSSVHRNRAFVKFHPPDYKVFRALDYDCTVEFFWSPFLVELKERADDHAKILRLDMLSGDARRWLGADVMVFNSGHWWTHRGKMRAWNYFELREQLTEDMEADEAFNRALRTWARWVDRHVDPSKTAVFFRSISPEHKRENLQWCYNQTEPITSERYVQWFPRAMVSLVERAVRRMRTPVTYLNITRLSEYRRDAHTAVYTSRQGKLLTAEQRKEPARYADCSHWCLPGMPDTWNVLMFASLIGADPSIAA